ncbi:accessory protein [denalis virus]|uniref:Accessory protein n=1 Tax=denalis virus TaxID=2940991 RepID=A0AAE9KYJ6_9MONO|nr:accessory protein [denalis virus]
MPSRFWRSLKKLRVPRRRSTSSSDSQLIPPQEPLAESIGDVKVRIGVRKNPDLVGLERSNKAQTQDLASLILAQLRDLEKDYPLQTPRIITNLEYSTLQFVKTILMRIMEGLPINSTWVRQVEEYICTTSQEKENLMEAVNWVRMMIRDQDHT